MKTLIPRTTRRTPAARSKNRESRTKIPRFDMKRPTTKKTIAMPRVKAIPIQSPSLAEEP
ncbi:MAG: hypothetical protein A4E50_00055 [Methanosaeta sp. PtaB.Bin087]|nr:MAG: hypothetical protein A4E50_00055 [Methanosaeta sp. PtaB.Bin087]